MEEMEEMRPRGRRRRRWMDGARGGIVMELKRSWEINWDVSKEREKWKELVSAAESLNGL